MTIVPPSNYYCDYGQCNYLMNITRNFINAPYIFLFPGLRLIAEIGHTWTWKLQYQLVKQDIIIDWQVLFIIDQIILLHGSLMIVFDACFMIGC